MPPFKLYGLQWEKPRPETKKGAGLAGDTDIKYGLGGKRHLLFSAQIANETTNLLKQSLIIYRNPKGAADDRIGIAPTKIQVNDYGVAWTFDPPKLIEATHLGAYFEDCLLADVLKFKFVIAVEKI